MRLHRHTVGDSKVPFCLQSCVKPLKYAVAVNDYGTEHVHSFIGKEPSGLRFNKLFLNEDGESARDTCYLRSWLQVLIKLFLIHFITIYMVDSH